MNEGVTMWTEWN